MDDKRIAEIKERLELAPSYCKENVTTGPVEHAVGLFSQDLDLGEFALVFGPHSQADDESLARLFQHAPADILDLLADNEALRDLATRQHAMLG